MSNAFHDPILTTRKPGTAPRTSLAAPPLRAAKSLRLQPNEPLRETLMAALRKQLALLEEELRSALDGDPESVRAARAATRRIAVVLDVMRGTGAAERTAELRRRLSDIRRALDRAARSDVLIEAGMDRGVESRGEREGPRKRAYAKLGRRIDSKRTRKTLASLKRLEIRSTPGAEGLGVREAASLLLRRGCEEVGAYRDPENAKKRELKRLERDTGRLLYMLELFADVLTSAGGRLRSQLAEAQGHLAALRDAEVALDRQPSKGRRRRRDSLRAGIASKVAFLTEARLRDDVEAAIG